MMEGSAGTLLKGIITMAVLFTLTAIALGVLGCIMTRRVRSQGDQRTVYTLLPRVPSQAEQGFALQIAQQGQTLANNYNYSNGY